MGMWAWATHPLDPYQAPVLPSPGPPMSSLGVGTEDGSMWTGKHLFKR